MSSPEKKQRPDNTEMAHGYYAKRFLGQCEVCSHIGLAHRPCKQCEAKTVEVLADHSEVDPHFIGFCETEYLICEVCDHAVKMKEEGKECLKCIKNGNNINNNINKMVKPKVLEQRLLKQQKCLPQCAQFC